MSSNAFGTRPVHIAVGDIHGELDGFREILRHAGLVDGRDQWSGGDRVLVQTGDVVDRGPHSVEVLDLLSRLQRQATQAAGRVVRLCGNHELLLLQGAYHYANYPDPSAVALRLRQEIQGGQVLAAYAEGGVLFTHAGLREPLRRQLDADLTPGQRAQGPTGLASALNEALVLAVQSGDLASHPMFHVDRERGGSHEVGGIFWGDYSLLTQDRPQLDLLQVLGHTPAGRPELRHAHKYHLINIDAGMFQRYGGVRAYLEVAGDGAMTDVAKVDGVWRRVGLR